MKLALRILLGLAGAAALIAGYLALVWVAGRFA